ncbi:MAG: alpha-hydroxy-acid oxidizing protein [Gammaproteobacteria bacterium]|nr:alpha-hydroxy-acid oxidizing protein [Gammaproteobacteria bacterium]
MKTSIFSVNDAREAARKRMPRIMFDYIDGAAGEEYACGQNISVLDQIRLQPRVLINIENRNLKKTFLGRQWDLPFGIAPMGMCNLTWPGADQMLATAATRYNIPLGLSTMASSSIETTWDRAGSNSWFQLYVGQSEDIAFDMVRRAENCGYDTLILTVDVPMVALRPRERRNGFQAPLRIGPKQFFDFATHPQWSIRTLLTGVPKVANNEASNTGGKKKFVRNESRGKVDWNFLDRLRDRWKGHLIIKGVLSTEDAIDIKKAGADGLYISNHGGRQLDSAPAAIEMLPVIREAVGDSFPIIFDSGVRNGEAVVKALACGADFVMLGRALLYGIGGGSNPGLTSVIELFIQQVDTALAQIGKTDINTIDKNVLLEKYASMIFNGQ